MTPEPTVRVVKRGLVIPISREMAMDAGVIPDDRPRPTPTRRQRFRWWREDQTHTLRMRLASLIAGFDVEGDDR